MALRSLSIAFRALMSSVRLARVCFLNRWRGVPPEEFFLRGFFGAELTPFGLGGIGGGLRLATGTISGGSGFCCSRRSRPLLFGFSSSPVLRDLRGGGFG